MPPKKATDVQHCEGVTCPCLSGPALMLLVRASSGWQTSCQGEGYLLRVTTVLRRRGSEDVANSVQKGGANRLEDTMTLKACLLIG